MQPVVSLFRAVWVERRASTWSVFFDFVTRRDGVFAWTALRNQVLERMQPKHFRRFKRPSRTTAFQSHSPGDDTRRSRMAGRRSSTNPVWTLNNGQNRRESCVRNFAFLPSTEDPANRWHPKNVHISGTWDSNRGSTNMLGRMRGDIKDAVRLHHDNAPSHTALIVTNFLAHSNAQVVLQPSVSILIWLCVTFFVSST